MQPWNGGADLCADAGSDPGLRCLSIDVGGWTHQKSNLASAADAGSLAGASELVRALQDGDQSGAAGRADAVALKLVRANDPAVEKYRIESSSVTPIQVVVELDESGKQTLSQLISASPSAISADSLAMVVEELTLVSSRSSRRPPRASSLVSPAKWPQTAARSGRTHRRRL